MHFEFGVTSLLMRSAVIRPHAPAVAFGSRTVLTYQELMRRVAAFSARTRQIGLNKGDRVAILAKNHPAWLEIMFGCWHAGLAIVPINVKLHAQEVAYILQDSGAALMFVDEGHADGVQALNLVPQVQGMAIDTPEYENLFSCPGGEPVAVEPGNLAWLFYTSGTTGRPKGAMLSHANLLAMAQAYSTDVEPEGVGRALLHAAPMSHGSGLYILPHVLHGSLHICPQSRGFDVPEIERLLEHHEGVSFFAAPTMATRLMAGARGSLPGMQTLICGGAPMYVADARSFIERFGGRLAQIYGQGESPMTITALPKSLHDLSHPLYESRLASCGLVQVGMQVRVVDDEGSRLPAGEAGEVIVKGPAVMSGYWNLPEATARTLRQGWLFTGDIGSFDEDGFLTLKDRSKDVIISGGSNIYPREVEEVLLRHPSVREVAIVGMPDSDWGEVVVAFIVARQTRDALEHELDQLCMEQIARFKRPKRYILLEDLPKNAAGKIVKNELRALLAGSAP